MKIELLDSRRLTGPNLFATAPGAVLDVAIEGIPAEQLIIAWKTRVQALMSAVGWDATRIASRQFNGGASLMIQAPIDVLYSACELNEAALDAAITSLSDKTPRPEKQTASDLAGLIAAERKPALLQLQTAAAEQQVPFLWDDNEVSLGYGKTARVWPVTELPDPATLDWTQFSSIPLGIVTGTNGKSTTVRLAAAILAAAGFHAGVTSTDYIRVGEITLEEGDFSGPGGARTLLRHPEPEAVVLEVARGGLLRRGIGVERADAALITNIAAEHLGDYGINTVEDMAQAKFIVRKALGENAPLILNADDPESVRFAKALRQHVVWFGMNPESGVLQQHLQAGEDAAFLQDHKLMLQTSGVLRCITHVNDVPVTFDGAARYNIGNCLAAMLLCHILGASDEALRNGLGGFSGDADSNPGRGNLFRKNGIRVFLDFAHNEHGVRAIAATVNAFNADRNIVLMGQAGDRHDQDIAGLVTAVAALSPARLLVCDLPGYERGRQPMETAHLISRLAVSNGVPATAISLFTSPVEGVRSALANAKSGDCLVLLALTQRAEVIALIREFVAQD